MDEAAGPSPRAATFGAPGVQAAAGAAGAAGEPAAVGAGTAASPLAGTSLPLEWWERAAQRWAAARAAWAGAHPRLWLSWCRARVAAVWVALAVVLTGLVFSATYRHSLQASLGCLLLLVWWYALARTKTLPWRAVSLLLTTALAWAPMVAVITTVTSHRLTTAAGQPHDAIRLTGASTAVAGFGEESLKLVPLLVVALVAPGRVRRFAVVDWLLAGFACGLGFQMFEDFARRLVEATSRPGILDLLLALNSGPHSGNPEYGLGPLSGGSSTTAGALHIAYAGHHVFTALVAAGIGLGVAAWRHARRCSARSAWRWRLVALAVPAGLFWLVAVDHFGYNAALDDSTWASPAPGQVATAPALVRWTWRAGGHGFGRGGLLLVLLVVALLVDAHRTARLPAPGGLGTALMAAGAADYGLTHAHGLATLTRDPRSAARSYFSTHTPQGMLLDALSFVLTFLPTGTGAVYGAGIRHAVREYLRDPVAFRAARRAAFAEKDLGQINFGRPGNLSGVNRAAEEARAARVAALPRRYHDLDVRSAPAGRKGGWNKELNKPEPNSVYLVDDRHAFVTDAQARVVHVDSRLQYRDGTTAAEHRNGYQQRVAGRKDRLEFDQGGHLVAASLGGPGEGINLVAMSKNLNGAGKSSWSAMEADLRKILHDRPDADVRFQVDVAYPGGGTRPSEFLVQYSVDGGPITPVRFKQ